LLSFFAGDVVKRSIKSFAPSKPADDASSFAGRHEGEPQRDKKAMPARRLPMHKYRCPRTALER
jgi:hypothetical protein